MKDEIDTADTHCPELPAVVAALLDALEDKQDLVKQSVVESIRKISQKQPGVVIHAAIYYWELHRKGPMESLLKVITDVCRDYEITFDDEVANSLADLAMIELMGNATQQSAELLVALSKNHSTQVMRALITKFAQPEVIPHHNIIHALGVVASGNPLKMLPFFKVTLSVLVPLLPDMHKEEQKLDSCIALGKIAEAISYCLMNAGEDSFPGFCKDNFVEEFSAGFEVLTHSWLRSSRDSKLIEATLISLCSILPLLPKSYDEQSIMKLTPVFLNLCKKPNVRLTSTRVLALILESATVEDKELLRPYLEQMHHILNELICIEPFEASRDALLTHYEILRCLRAVVVLYPEEGLDRILQQLRSPSVMSRSKALIVLRHLINTLPAEDDASLQRIALSLQESLGDVSTRQMVGAVVALAARPSVPLLPSQRASFVRFMVLHCGTKSDEAEAYEEALHLLSSTVEGAECWLWPSLIKALLDPTYVNSVIPVLKALSPLAVKVIRDESNIDEQREFPSIKVLGRCLELLGDEKYRLMVVTFLRCSAPLYGYQLKPQWDRKLLELAQFLEQNSGENFISASEKNLMWEEKLVEFLEESVQLEGDAWGAKLADEIVVKPMSPSLAIILAAVSNNPAHVSLLVEKTRTQPPSSPSIDYSRAVGICAKLHLNTVLKIMKESCAIEDSRKQPVKLLGLIKDTKAAATAEAAKAGLLKSYAEIAKKGDSAALYSAIENHILPRVIRYLLDCKEISTKEAGLLALEQIGAAVHPNRLIGTSGLRSRGAALSTVLALLQSTSGHRPLQLYPLILRSAISMIKIPPALSTDEKEVVLTTLLDKVIAASSEIVAMKMKEVMQQVFEGLGTFCSDVVSDSADTLAMFVEILLPWMQSNSSSERKTTLFVLRTTLRSYHDSLKYTYPGGKLEPGRLLGRILSWSADPEYLLRPLVVDCVALTLSIGARHRSTLPDNNLNHDLSESKRIIISEDLSTFYEGIENLATAVCERVASGEIVSLAEGLIEGLLYRGEGGVAACLALSKLFKIRGYDIPRTHLYLIDHIIAQMRQMENLSCKRGAAAAVKAMMAHHPHEVVEHLLQQPLPLDHGCQECWRELGSCEDIGTQTLEILLARLENANLLVESSTDSSNTGKTHTASFSSLAAIVAIGHLLRSSKAEKLIERQLADLLAILLKYLAGWLHVDPPISIMTTKFGFVPSRETCKICPHREVFSVLSGVFRLFEMQESLILPHELKFDTELDADENLVVAVTSVVQCISNRNDLLSNLARTLGKLITSVLPAQRAVAAAFYAELIGNPNCDADWLDSIVNTLQEAKADSSPLVRKLATIGLTKVAFLDTKQVEEYFDVCLTAMLSGLEEPSSGDGSSEVVLESLRGLSVLLSVKTEKPMSPTIVLALKPFVEKENWEMRLYAISALGAIAKGWVTFASSPDDDATDHLLGCIPSLAIKLEDPNTDVAQASREVLCASANILQCKPLAHTILTYLGPETKFCVESFLRELIKCLRQELPQKAEEFRNDVVRGYSRSENGWTRSTSALILGLFGEPRPEDVQRMLQLLRDKDNNVRARAAEALAVCFIA